MLRRLLLCCWLLVVQLAILYGNHRKWLAYGYAAAGQAIGSLINTLLGYGLHCRQIGLKPTLEAAKHHCIV